MHADRGCGHESSDDTPLLVLTCGSVFSGIGLLDYGLHLAGIEHRWLCEYDPWRRGILTKRWPGVRVLDDVRDAGHGCEPVDLIAGGFPCKGASNAGKQNGFDHPETVLWREMRRAVRELRPRYVLVENVANILSLQGGAVWGEVLGDLATLGYGVVWDCIPAAAIGAPHRRDRVFAVATHPDRQLQQARDADTREERSGRNAPRGSSETAADASGAGLEGRRLPGRSIEHPEAATDADGGRQQEQSMLDRSAAARGIEVPSGDDAQLRGVRVEWGAYGPAIRRWEHIRGPAPEPLVRRMGARGAARVERSRLSALGDGVQVQVGRIAGEYILDLERQRLVRVAAQA